jgi:putative oxidoreductase
MSTQSMSPAHDTFALIGRVLIALLFVPAGWAKVVGFAGTVGYIQSQGVPLPEVAAAVGIAAELGLALLLLVGWQARWAALGLAVFTFVISFIFHNYWGVPAEQVMAQRGNFFKNMAISGGLLAFAAFGAGAFSLDGRRRNA